MLRNPTQGVTAAVAEGKVHGAGVVFDPREAGGAECWHACQPLTLSTATAEAENRELFPAPSDALLPIHFIHTSSEWRIPNPEALLGYRALLLLQKRKQSVKELAGFPNLPTKTPLLRAVFFPRVRQLLPQLRWTMDVQKAHQSEALNGHSILD